MFVQNLKFVDLPVPENEIMVGSGYPKKFRQSLDAPGFLFSHIVKGFCSNEPYDVLARFEVRSFTCS